jgi:hypothetical protein
VMLKNGRQSWDIWNRSRTDKGSNCKVGLAWGAVWMGYDGGTETIAIFVIRDDSCHARKGSIEAFWVGFPMKLHASLFEYGRFSTCS